VMGWLLAMSMIQMSAVLHLNKQVLCLVK